MIGRFRFGKALVLLLGLAAGCGTPAWGAGHHHPLSAKDRATIAREARQMLAEPGVSHVGFYGFTIDRSGHVLDAWIVQSSGKVSLDKLALAAIRRAVLRHRPARSSRTMRFITPMAFRKSGVIERKSGGKQVAP